MRGEPMMEKPRISDNVIRRLPRYIRQLDMLLEAGVVRASSGEIGQQMGLTASQIRQDLNYFGGFGQPGYGYNVAELRQQLLEILGVSENRTAVVIGVGNLGRALVRNFHFSDCGFRLIAAFDSHADFNGTRLCTVPVYHVDRLDSFLQENRVDVAVLTVPSGKAAEIARLAVDRGVRGIWNFTNTELRGLPPEIVVENVHFSDSLMALNYYLKEHSGD